MGLDIYFSKKTFIGAMFRSSGISGIISLTKRGVPIPIKAERLAYVEEDIFHGRKTYWLLEWLNHELSEVLTNAGEQEISGDVMDRLHQACIEVLAHKELPDFREVCREKLRCLLKPDISEEAKNSFIEEVRSWPRRPLRKKRRPMRFSTCRRRGEGEGIMNCPRCGGKAYPSNAVRSPATLLGTGAGGYVAATAGAHTGAIVGSLLFPGIGTLLGILVGAAGGAVAGNTVGKLVDENVIRRWECPDCGYSWRM